MAAVLREDASGMGNVAFRWDPRLDTIVRSDRLASAVLTLAASDPDTIAKAASEAVLSAVDQVTIIVGAGIDRIAPAVAGLPVSIETNPGWAEGIASSIRRAVAWASRQRVDALVLAIADPARPLRATHLDRLIGAYRSSHRAVASRYAGVLAMPAVFDRSEYPSLLSLDGDRGARPVVFRTSTPVIVDLT